MTVTAFETLPAPADPHKCWGCGRRYNDDDVRIACVFIGRGDYEADGDRRLAYYNCTCDCAGTFNIVEDPPAVEPLENLRALFAYRKKAYEVTRDVRAQLGRKAQIEMLPELYDRLVRAIECGQELAERESLMHTLKVRIELADMKKTRAETLREAIRLGLWMKM